ncbi:hypothetical protein Tco_1134747 [Tanacetum coccineum]
MMTATTNKNQVSKAVAMRHEREENKLDRKQDEESDDDDQEEEEFDQENESEDDEMKKPTETATGIVQGTDMEMTEAQQGNENLETTQEQVVEDAHVIISTIPKKTITHLLLVLHRSLRVLSRQEFSKDSIKDQLLRFCPRRGQKDKDKDEDPSARSDRGLKKRKLTKDSVQSEEPVFEVANSDLPQDQEGNLGDNEDEPRNETASRHD